MYWDPLGQLFAFDSSPMGCVVGYAGINFRCPCGAFQFSGPSALHPFLGLAVQEAGKAAKPLH